MERLYTVNHQCAKSYSLRKPTTSHASHGTAHGDHDGGRLHKPRELRYLLTLRATSTTLRQLSSRLRSLAARLPRHSRCQRFRRSTENLAACADILAG